MNERASMPPLISIVGPTASGKTSLAIAIARAVGGEIVSADSRQVYRGMDIGTAKPTAEERAAIPHHLIDIKNPDEEYAVAEYRDDAIAAIRGVIARGAVPLLVGGTGLYVRSVVENLDIPHVEADLALRAVIERDIAEQGLGKVFEKLLTLDPDAESVVDPKNPRRVIRALEVAMLTGQPFTAQRKKSAPLFNALEIGLDLSTEVLRARIDARVDAMIAQGLINEVRELIARYDPLLPALDAIGYREVIEYLQGGRTEESAIAEIKANTIHYAKRQRTWFRKEKAVVWMNATAPDLEEQALALASKMLLE